MVRRWFLRSLVAAGVAVPFVVSGLPLRRLLAAEDTPGPVKFRWRVPVVHKRTVEESLRYEGTVEEEQDKKGVFVFVFVGVVLLPYLAKSVLELTRQVEHGGVIVDACGEEVDIATDKRMPSGMVVVRSCEGADVKVHRDEIEAPSQLAGFIEKALGAQ